MEESVTPTPRRIQLVGLSEIQITWDDGTGTTYSSAFLRNNCPCATCTGHGEKPPIRIPEEDPHSLPILGQEQVRVTGAEQVGHYAIQFSFSDKHKSGIYSFDYLCQLAGFLKNLDSG